MKAVFGALLLLTAATDDSCGPTTTCQDSVKFIGPASSGVPEHACAPGAKLEVTNKDQSIVAVCKCQDNNTGKPPDAGTITEEKK